MGRRRYRGVPAAVSGERQPLGSAALLLVLALAVPARAANPPYGLVIHGGAGTILREQMTPELDAQYRAALAEALNAGYAKLAAGGSALEAVTTAIVLLEDNPLFNAGKGAVLNADGICELDASIMDGRTRAAGAVAGLHRIKNPILLAQAVMDRSPHVMLVGDGAERFAQEQGFAFVPNEYFRTERRIKELERVRESQRPKKTEGRRADLLRDPPLEHKYGTVGCVALDQHGNLAAGTSTGGLTNKQYGRVGDSPIIGAGTYADNAACAVSCTGTGEFFIRVGAARDLAARIVYAKSSLADAAAATLRDIGTLGGDGGLIALDREGHVALPFNTEGMYRAYRLSAQPPVIAIYRDEASPHP